MAKLHHATLKKHVATYSELVISDLAAAEAQMSEAGLAEDEIAQVVEAVTNAPEGGEEPSKSEPKKPTKKGSAEVLHFEKTELRAIMNNQTKQIEWKKGDVLRIVKITQAQADILNEQSVNTKIGYYLTEK